MAYPVASFADAQYALHKGPKGGAIPVEWERGTDRMEGTLEVADGWRKTNITWRSSLFDILPSLPVSGDDLTAGREEGARPAGEAGRVPAGQVRPLDAQGGRAEGRRRGRRSRRQSRLTGRWTTFWGYVRREHLVGDTVILNVLRDGQPVEVRITLK